jgi:hypothetical protein
MQEAGQDRQERAGIVQALGSAIAIATFCYFILCFTLIMVVSRTLDMPLIYYFSFEDYLKAGVEINLPIAVMLALIILLLWAVYYSAPKDINDTVLLAILKEQTKIIISKYVLVLILVSAAIWEFLIDVQLSEDSKWRVVSSILFWLIASAAFVYWMLSIRVEFMIPSVIFLIFIAANIWAGHLADEAFQRSRANIAITLIDDPNHSISGVLIMPAGKGIIYLAAELCEQRKDNSFRFVSWEAVSRVQTVSSSAEDCALRSDRRGAPIR